MLNPAQPGATRGQWTNWLSRAPSLITATAILLAIVPFLALARFAHPSYDDWSAAERLRALGFWGAAKFWYEGWTGRFTSIALWNLTPITDASIQGYRFIAPVLMAGLFVGLWWLAREVLNGILPTWRPAGVAVTVLAIYVFGMASPAEGLYWYNGASVTTFGLVFALPAVAAAIRSQRSDSSAGAWSWAVAAGLFSVLAAGCNEIVLILLGSTLLVVAWLGRQRAWARWQLLLVPLVMAAGAGVADLLASGNYKRAAASGGLTSIIGPLIGSAAATAASILEWLSRGALIVGAVALVVAGATASARLPEDSPWRSTSWLLPILTAVAGVWGIFFFTHLASGFSFRPGPPDRVMNVGFFFFLLLGMHSAFMLGAQVLSRWSVLPDARSVQRWCVALMAVLLFGDGNVRQAYVDLVTGRASTYDRELTTRHEALRTASHRGQAVTVPPLSRIPRTLLFKDITTDPEHPHNLSYAAFWDVPQVKTSSQ